MVERVSNPWPFIVLEHQAATDTGLHLYLYARDNPNQMLAYLADTWDRSFTSALVGPGVGSFSIHADHPAAHLLRYGDLVRFRLDGTDRFTLVINRVEGAEVASGDDVARILRVSGKGVLSLLSSAQTYPQSNGDPVRGFPGITPGHLSRVLVDEAIARGALSGVTRGYSDTLDSNNQAWDVSLDQTERAATDLLRVHERIAEVAADVWMTPLLELRMANTRGVDRSFQTDDVAPVVFRPGQNAVEVAREIDTKVVNVLLIETPAGMVERSDGPSVAEHGRMEDSLSLGNVTDSAAVDRVAAAYFSVWAQPRDHLTLSLTYTDPLPWVRWGEGDWVRVYELDGSWKKLRVVAITVTEQADGTLLVIPELSTISEQMEERMRRWLDAMSRGTAAGTATRIAEPVPVTAEVASQVSIIAGDSVATHTATVVHADILDDLTDVSVSSPAAGDMVARNGSSQWAKVGGTKATGKIPEIQSDGSVQWATHAKILDDLTDVSVPSPTQGDMVARDGSSQWAKVGGTKSTGNVPTVQADGSIQWEAPPAGGGGGGVIAMGEDSFSAPSGGNVERTVSLASYGITQPINALTSVLRIHERADGSSLSGGGDVWAITEAWLVRTANDGDQTQPPDSLRYRARKLTGGASGYTVYVDWSIL